MADTAGRRPGGGPPPHRPAVWDRYAAMASPSARFRVSVSGNSPLAFFEWSTVPFTVTSKTPPPEGKRISAVIWSL